MKSVEEAKPLWKDDFVSLKTKCYHANPQVLWRSADRSRLGYPKAIRSEVGK
jgi:hypothetical protein